jgi:hypothetical protein
LLILIICAYSCKPGVGAAGLRVMFNLPGFSVMDGDIIPPTECPVSSLLGYPPPPPRLIRVKKSVITGVPGNKLSSPVLGEKVKISRQQDGKRIWPTKSDIAATFITQIFGIWAHQEFIFHVLYSAVAFAI